MSSINSQHFDGWECLGLEAQQPAGIGHIGLPTDGKVLAPEAVGRLGHYCKSFKTVCMSVLAWANTAVAAWVMICALEAAVLASAKSASSI